MMSKKLPKLIWLSLQLVLFLSLCITKVVAITQWSLVYGSSDITQYNVFGRGGSLGTPSPTVTPGALRGSVIFYSQSRNALYVFGGCRESGNTLSNSLLRYDFSTNMWVWLGGSDTPNAMGTYSAMGVASPTNMPGARSFYGSHSYFNDATGILYMFCGSGRVATGWMGKLNDGMFYLCVCVCLKPMQ